MTGEQLRAALAAKRRTQQELADHMGRTVRTINRLVAKRREQIPRYIELGLASLPERALEPTDT